MRQPLSDIAIGSHNPTARAPDSSPPSAQANRKRHKPIAALPAARLLKF
jgi:hypothetical protein